MKKITKLKFFFDSIVEIPRIKVGKSQILEPLLNEWHYFASTVYAKTREILYVKQQLGHVKIETTLKYVQLLNLSEDDEYTCKTATNAKEATQLI